MNLKTSLVGAALASSLSLSAKAEPLKVFPGWPVVLEGDGAKLADPSVAEVTVTKEGVRLVGKKEGHTTLTLSHGKGAPETIALDVAGAGFRMVKVAVSKRALEPGVPVTRDLIEERLLPLCFDTNSLVKADQAQYVLQHRVIVPVQAGEVFSWIHFAPNEADEVAKRAQIAKEASEAQSKSVSK